MTRPRIVAVSAGLWSPSRTTALASEILKSAAARLDGEPALVELGPFAAALGSTFSRGDAKGELRSALETVERADVLIAASPVFRGTFTGHFKHFFDLVELGALKGTFVVVAAAGGGEKHCLTLEYALKPLFGFFQAIVVPSGVYATEADFAGGEVHSTPVLSRIADAIEELAAISQAPVAESGASRMRSIRASVG